MKFIRDRIAFAVGAIGAAVVYIVLGAVALAILVLAVIFGLVTGWLLIAAVVAVGWPAIVYSRKAFAREGPPYAASYFALAMVFGVVVERVLYSTMRWTHLYLPGNQVVIYALAITAGYALWRRLRSDRIEGATIAVYSGTIIGIVIVIGLLGFCESAFPKFHHYVDTLMSSPNDE